MLFSSCTQVFVKSFFAAALISSEELAQVRELLVPGHSPAVEQVCVCVCDHWVRLLHTSNKLGVNSHGVTLHLSQASYALVV